MNEPGALPYFESLEFVFHFFEQNFGLFDSVRIGRDIEDFNVLDMAISHKITPHTPSPSSEKREYLYGSFADSQPSLPQYRSQRYDQ